MLNLNDIFSNDSEIIALSQQYRDGKKISVFGVCSFAKSVIVSLCAKDLKESVLVVTSDFYTAKNTATQLEHLVNDVVLLPARDDTLTYRDVVSGESVLMRLSALGKIATKRAKIIVCPVEAILQIFPKYERFLSAIITIEKDKEYNLEELVKALVLAGYKREEQITDVGRFSLRGDILDVWAVGENAPMRIEFFGDTAERVCLIDEETHKSGQELNECIITPATEFFATQQESEKIVQGFSQEDFSALEPDYAVKAKSILGEIVSRLNAQDSSVSLSYLLPLVPSDSAIEFIRPFGVVYDEVKQVYDNATMHQTEHNNRFGMLLSRGETMSFSVKSVIEREQAFLFSGASLAFQSINNANRIFNPDVVCNFKTMETPMYYKDYQLMENDFRIWTQRGYAVVVCTNNNVVHSNIAEFLSTCRIPFRENIYGANGVSLIKERAGRGAIFHNDKVVVVGTEDIAHKEVRKKIKRVKSDVFSAPEKGDYVVHDVHGIGRFQGVVKLETGGVRQDYLLVEYYGTDKLFLPIENMDSISKYVASDTATPKLSRLGGADFAKVKERVKNSVKTLAVDLVGLYGERLHGRGYKYSQDDSLLNEFSNSFEHSETDDQLVAIDEGLSDLKKGKIMDRLLCGDVGYGKTEVALRLAFKVIVEGKQVAFLAPTTILAKQHYDTVVARMEQFGVKVGRLTRFDSKAEQNHTIQELKAGRIDIVVGTHRLLSKDVDFADLGMLVLDEEQRFGVADKEKIKDLKRGVNVLTLSATPIPRTLHMSLVGIRDISVLDTPPIERLPVQTYVTEYSESLLSDACMREINRGGQVFIVYNKVADIERFTARVAQLVQPAKVSYAHGQMSEDKLEKRIEEFVAGNSDVLVTSTIVENGIDIPRANTMIVVDSDKLGLSQLYQLRGRVGRSNRLAYVFFTFDGRKMLSETALKRLDAITQFTEFGSGFRIAMRDLEIRGAGSILGAEQHGHMEKVGYDMYCKLLSEAVGELRGEKSREHSDVRVITDYALFVPDSYVSDKEWRLRVYSKIAKVSSETMRNALIDELTDIYGEIPKQVKNLIEVSLIKNLASNIGASAVILKKDRSELEFKTLADISQKVFESAIEHSARLLTADKPALKFENPTQILKFLLNCSKI